MIDGWTISGKTDLYETESGELLDFKRSSAFAFVLGKVERERQLNIYAELMRRNGHAPKSLGIVFFPEGWTKYQALRSPDYLQERVVVLPIPMWPSEKTTAFIAERLKAFREALDGNLPLCTEEERWAKPTTFAVMKAGRKTALKVFDNAGEAGAAASAAGATVEVRPGKSTRCEQYCAGSQWCSWSHENKPAETDEVRD